MGLMDFMILSISITSKYKYIFVQYSTITNITNINSGTFNLEHNSPDINLLLNLKITNSKITLLCYLTFQLLNEVKLLFVFVFKDRNRLLYHFFYNFITLLDLFFFFLNT